MFLITDDLKTKAPAAFRTKEEGAAPGASNKYQFMTTHDVISNLSDMGWNVYDAKQAKARISPTTAKHLLRFRNPHYGSLGKNGNIPEILFVNSHDRSSSLTFHVGIFRLICTNGLVVADKTFENFRIRHMGTTYETVRNTIQEITKGLPMVFQTINNFEGVILSKEQQLELAMKSLAIRFPEYLDVKSNEIRPDIIQKSVNLDELLTPVRNEDRGDNLWLTYNRLQEKIINGGFPRMGETNKVKSVRPLTNIGMSLKVNKGLWELASQYCPN